MRFAAIASIVMVGLATTGVAVAAIDGSQAPKRVALTGRISVLRLTTITVRGSHTLTCRITTTSPKVHPRGFAVGSKVRITCVKGILSTIAKPLVTSVAVSPSPAEPTPTVPEPGTGSVKIAPTVNGPGTITALGSGAIEFGGAITCQLTSSSPSVAPYRVGSRVNFTCTAGSLTAIGPSEAT